MLLVIADILYQAGLPYVKILWQQFSCKSTSRKINSKAAYTVVVCQYCEKFSVRKDCDLMQVPVNEIIPKPYTFVCEDCEKNSVSTEVPLNLSESCEPYLCNNIWSDHRFITIWISETLLLLYFNNTQIQASRLRRVFHYFSTMKMRKFDLKNQKIKITIF